VDVSVIICSYTLERWELLTRAVASVKGQTLPAQEIIVVIDGSDELEARATAELSGATVVANRHRQGLSGARQTGADLARAPILAFLDDDAIAEPEWLAEHAAAYEDPLVLGAGGSIEPMWLTTPPRWLPSEFNWVVGCTYAGMPTSGGRIRNPIGANMSVRAEVLARAGSFEASLGRVDRGTPVAGTAEETEFCIRATRLHPGHYWVYVPEARVQHAVPAERATWRYFARRCRVEGAAKAVLTGLTGTPDGLESERLYVRSVLPRAVARELRRATRGQLDGLGHALTIVAGLLITAWAYAAERARLVRAAR
jgi:glucosyl-dolichyl phosphate glucuronosyltransferase